MAAAAAPAEPTIDDLPDHILTEVMLRVPTPAALVHAAAVSKRWRGVIVTSTGKFLEDYRERHKSSPFLGLYIPREFGGLPSFQMADSIQSADDDDDRDPDLQRAAAKALTSSLGGLERHPEWRLLDCYNGRLLLARGPESLEVYNPLSRERISVGLPQDVVLPNGFSTCLLQGHGNHESSFRVVSVQSHRRDRMVNAVEYDSCRKSWNHHRDWKILKNIEGTQREVMYAGNLIFCKYTGASLLLLDTREMQFSVLPLPGYINPKTYAIGEMEDGVCCLAAVEPVGKLNTPHLRVWRLEKLDWKLEKAVEVVQVLGKHALDGPLYYRACKVTNGMAVLCSSGRNLHFVVDLKTFRVMEKFEFNRDLPAFPMQMHWPPAFSVTAISSELSSPIDGAAVCGAEAEGAETDEEAAETSCGNEDSKEGSNTEEDVAEESPPPSPPSRGRCCKRVATPDLTLEDDEAEEGKKLLVDGEALAVALQRQKSKRSMNPPVATVSVMNPGSEGAGTDFHRRRQLGEHGDSPPDHLRCRRSDGKKWRCLGYALPTVSFCEYHYTKANKGKKLLPVDGEVLAVALHSQKSNIVNPLMATAISEEGAAQTGGENEDTKGDAAEESPPSHGRHRKRAATPNPTPKDDDEAEETPVPSHRRRRQKSPLPQPDHLRCCPRDGKKWRCSGRALPTFSFCEYHYVQAKKGKKLRNGSVRSSQAVQQTEEEKRWEQAEDKRAARQVQALGLDSFAVPENGPRRGLRARKENVRYSGPDWR